MNEFARLSRMANKADLKLYKKQSAAILRLFITMMILSLFVMKKAV